METKLKVFEPLIGFVVAFLAQKLWQKNTELVILPEIGVISTDIKISFQKNLLTLFEELGWN